ncbi:MAG: 30S ribosome-binding factor RbfA [Deltaproteobacteria bacterium]|jgi:ribosome-binding factor A|nr:30S ribosome-binding factor RbfA [Deltaproteobacteria bacterium]
MSGGNPRRARVSQAIKGGLGELIGAEVKDPRVATAGLLSVTHVDLNSDMSVATVYVSFVGGPEGSGARAIAALDGAAGFLRGPLGRKLGMARSPSLRFRLDESGEFHNKLSEIVRDDQRKASSEDDEGEA